VTGTPAVGQMLTTTTGTWTGNPAPTYEIAWQTAPASGGPWTATGATGATYQLTSANLGQWLRSEITASNASGSSTAASNTVGPVGQPGVALDANLGATGIRTSGGTTQLLTTTAAAAPGSRIVVVAGNWNSTTTPLAATDTAGNTYTRHAQISNGNERLAIFSAHAPGGLAAGSTITVTFTANSSYTRAMAASFTGIASTNAVDQTVTATQAGSANTWATGTLATPGGQLLLFGAAGIAGDRTSVPGAGWTEIHDVHASSADEGTTSVFQIAPAAGTYQATGAWSAAGSLRTGAIVSFKPATP
jgi:hypothetical protein